MSKARLIYELNEVLHREYGIEQSIEEPITVRDLAIIVQALKQGKVREHEGPTISTEGKIE
jgi:hypothetical protein